jgi:hypothetical protein
MGALQPPFTQFLHHINGFVSNAFKTPKFIQAFADKASINREFGGSG